MRVTPASRTLSDAELLELRALHEFEGWPYRRLMKRYGVCRSGLTRYAEYVTRAKLRPTRAHLPKDIT